MNYNNIQAGMLVKKVKPYSKSIDWAFGDPDRTYSKELKEGVIVVSKYRRSMSWNTWSRIQGITVKSKDGRTFELHPRELEQVKINFSEVV